MNFLASKNTSQALLSKTITTTKHLWIQSSCVSTLVSAPCMSDVSVCFQTQKPGNVCFSTEKHWAMTKVEKVGTSGRGWKTFNSKSLFSPVSLASMMWLKGLLLELKDRATQDWPLTGCVPLVTYHIRSLNNRLSISRAWWIWVLTSPPLWTWAYLLKWFYLWKTIKKTNSITSINSLNCSQHNLPFLAMSDVLQVKCGVDIVHLHLIFLSLQHAQETSSSSPLTHRLRW